MHLAVCMDMYFATPRILTPLLTNFTVAVLHQIMHILYNHDINIFNRYHDSEFYIDISVYRYIAHITTMKPLCAIVTANCHVYVFAKKEWSHKGIPP